MKPESYVNLYEPSHPLSVGVGVVGAHRAILYSLIGDGQHKCHWCDRPVQWGKGVGPGVLVVDHLDGDHRNNEPANLVPSCHTCNITRSEKSTAIKPDELFVIKSGRKNRAVKRMCQKCGTEFLHKASERRADRGRFCSQFCGANGRENIWNKRRANQERNGLRAPS